jgi:hypothetical protein
MSSNRNGKPEILSNASNSAARTSMARRPRRRGVGGEELGEGSIISVIVVAVVSSILAFLSDRDILRI